MRRLRMGAAVLLAALGMSILLSACGAGAVQGAADPVETDRVELPQSYLFRPAVIRVAAGTNVAFHNGDNFTHGVQVLKEGFNLLNLAPGASGTLTFAEPGEYDYVCPYHAQQMKGKVIVVSRPGT